MNSKALKTLEFNKIIDMLVANSTTPLGQKKCSELTPSCNINDIKLMQTETSDALKRLWQKGSVSFSGTRDITEHIKRLEVGSNLSIKELLDISSVLNVALKIKSFSKNTEGEDYNDSLSEMFNSLEPLSPLNNEIKRCIISDEEIADDASSTLSSIRRSMKNINQKVHDVLNAMLNSQTTRTMLQDFVVTMRNGRYCLPVKAEYKNNFQGMIHDQSATGSTVFIEPMGVVNLNNELRQLTIKENEEIEKILATLSASIAEHTEEIYNDLIVLSELDFIFARAALSKSLKCSEPVFSDKGIINLKCARHPLLNQKTVVPINITLGDEYNLLVVTGPNTGGKTVSLKTTGLLSLMGQAGLHIPCDEGSTLNVFNDIFADIGDEQSIEQSLSTFSSHMTNIIKILDKADDRSLVLFDELCAGTDPTEGAALAISILTFLHNLNAKVMTTTHYSELKLFALSTEGVQNASCEFSVETLSPTYRLLIGVPGKSNAFAISGKLGLPSYIIEDAKKLIDTDKQSFEDVVTSLEESRLTIEREQAEIEKYKLEVKELKEALEKKYEKLDDRRERILSDATMEAEKILQDAKSFADETIRNINKAGNDIKELERLRSGAREKLNDNDKKKKVKEKKTKTGNLTAKDLRIGDTVKVLSMNLEGTVSTMPNDKGMLFVQMGILRSQVNIKDLILVDEPVITGPNMQKTSQGKIKMSKSFAISPEINLIGMTVDEAISALDKYLDDAYLAHLPQVRIVHGRGTGALKNAVHQHLKRLKYVSSYRLGAFGEGDTGVTIAEFK